MRVLTLSVLIVVAGAGKLNAQTLIPLHQVFVSTVSGSDEYPGTKAKPFATLQRARDAVRDLKHLSSHANAAAIVVNVRAGTYYLENSFVLTPEDSGTRGARIVYQAYDGEEVRLSGGVALPSNRFRPLSIREQAAPVDLLAKSQLVRLDLGQSGHDLVTKPHWERARPGQLEAAAPFELVVNDEIMRLARWPNEGWAVITKVVDPGPLWGKGAESAPGGSFEFRDNRLEKWIHEDAWVRGYWRWDWYDESLPIHSIDRASRRITVGRPTAYGLQSNARFYAFNVLSELDEAGEYYIDHKQHSLWFWPVTKMNASRPVITSLEAPVLVLQGASYITLKGFIIEDGRHQGIQIAGGQGVRIVDCVIRNLGRDGIVVEGGSEHEIVGSKIHHVGTRGIVLSGGDRRTLQPANHSVIGNDIHHYGRLIAATQPGIELNGVGHRLAHNVIHDAPHVGILFMGNDHVIELNEIHHVCEETSDAGAIYTGRDWTARGNIIHHNFFHHLSWKKGKGDVTAIYLDDLASGTTVVGNAMIQVHRGILIGGGRDNLVENNVFANCDVPLSLDARGATAGRGLLAQTGVLHKRLQSIPYQRPPWSTRYPRLTTILDNNPGLPKDNTVRRNVIFRCGRSIINPIAQLHGLIDTNWEPSTDPGFVDFANGNFRMKPGSPIYAKIPDWEAIPFDNIGVAHTGSETVRP